MYQCDNAFEIKTLYFLKVLYRTLLFLSWSILSLFTFWGKMEIRLQIDSTKILAQKLFF